MKKTLSRSLLVKAKTPSSERDVGQPDSVLSRSDAKTPSTTAPGLPNVGGAGSAWKAGAAEQNKAALAQNRQKAIEDILSGRYELMLEPSQVEDRIGTDRRKDWQDQEAFQNLKASIEKNGQDTPIQVWPVDTDWTPDPLDPGNVGSVQFELIIGRRRHAIAKLLGRPVRAVLASPEKRGSPDEHFEMLFMRFRENEERENLGPFERLVSIGEMFEELLENSQDEKPTAVSFAKRIGVHESIVSRGRSVFKARDQILNKFKNVYDLSFPELQKAVSGLTSAKTVAAKSVKKPKQISVTRKVGSRKISLTSQGGKLSIRGAGLVLDEQGLNGLGDVIAAYLDEKGLKN